MAAHASNSLVRRRSIFGALSKRDGPHKITTEAHDNGPRDRALLVILLHVIGAGSGSHHLPSWSSSWAAEGHEQPVAPVWHVCNMPERMYNVNITF